MSIKNILKYGVINNLLKNLFCKKTITIFLGKHGITISFLKKNIVHDSLYVEYGTDKYYQKYRSFLSGYKGYEVNFLLDHNECELTHEMLPILSSLLKINPVDKFIAEKYSIEDIVAYNIYEITDLSGEVWNTCIAKTPFLFPLSDVLRYVIKKSYKYNGIFFFALEARTIIDRLLLMTDNSEHLDKLQIFTIITKASGIRIIVKYQDNIMSEKTVLYPHDKSDLYLIGTIEQVIGDKLLFYKQYIKKLGENPCIIFLIDNDLKQLTAKLVFENCLILSFTNEDIELPNFAANNRFQDSSLIELFNYNPSYIASNKSLNAITKYTTINRLAFKPVIATIFAMILTLCYYKYQVLSVQAEALNLNNQYYKLAKEYRDVNKKNPELSNIGDLLEMYNLQNILGRQSATPFKHLKMLILTQHKNLKLKNLSWRLVNPLLIDLPASNLKISLDVTYEDTTSSILDGGEIINGYANHLRANFDGFTIFNKTHEDIQITAKKVSIPAYFSIKGKVGGRSDD